MVKNVDTVEFDELLKGDKPVVCDFFATWCAPCRMLAPVMDGLSEKFAGKAEFVKVNVDECGELGARYGIMSIPLVIVFKGGEEIDRSVGYMTPSEGEEFLSSILG